MRTLTHGETFGSLTVLKAVQGKTLRYRVGCSKCGCSEMLVTARQFDKGKAWCRKCSRPRAKEA